MSAPQSPAAGPQNSQSQLQQNRETKRKFDGQCRHCGIHGHKWAECRKRLREETQNKPANSNSQPAGLHSQEQQPKAKYNLKLVCQICGKVGHSARDCYGQSTEENKQFRRDFRQNNARVYNTNELSHTTNDEAENAEVIERHDNVEDPKNF